MSNERQTGNAIALLPLGVFLVLFIGSGIISGDFYKMPTFINVCMWYICYRIWSTKKFKF